MRPDKFVPAPDGTIEVKFKNLSIHLKLTDRRLQHAVSSQQAAGSASVKIRAAPNGVSQCAQGPQPNSCTHRRMPTQPDLTGRPVLVERVRNSAIKSAGSYKPAHGGRLGWAQDDVGGQELVFQ